MTHPLEEILKDVNGSTFISIDTSTVPVLRGGKANPQQGHINKIMIGANVMVFQNKTASAYGNMVQRRLIAEGKNPESFELSPRTWGERRPGTPFIEHNGELYLEVIFLRPGKVEYKHGVRPIMKEDIQGLNEQVDAMQGGLENKVVIRTFKVASIKRIVVNKIAHTL